MTAGLDARRSALGELLTSVARVTRRVIGVPDYETYLAHRREKHPGEAVMSREEFTRERQDARYATPGGRCC